MVNRYKQMGLVDINTSQPRLVEARPNTKQTLDWVLSLGYRIDRLTTQSILS